MLAATSTVCYTMIITIDIFIKGIGESLEWVSIIPPMLESLMFLRSVYTAVSFIII